ncbi:MAG: BolA family protein [Methylocystis sp.]
MTAFARGPISARITEKLTQGLSPVSLKVIDESHHHAAHGHHHAEGETHFRVEVISEKFEGKSRIDRHRYRPNSLLSPAHKFKGLISLQASMLKSLRREPDLQALGQASR